MKKNAFLLCCLLLLAILGCKKKKNVEEGLPTYTMGSIGLTVDDMILPKKDMNLTVFALRPNISGCQFSDNYTLHIQHKAHTHEYVEKIILSHISPKKVGPQKVITNITNNCDSVVSAAIYIGGSDFTWFRYYPLNKANNTITLNAYNAATKEVSGTFDITFANAWGTPESRKFYFDTIRLHKCAFRAVINE
jgi:hypothetical protein